MRVTGTAAVCFPCCWIRRRNGRGLVGVAIFANARKIVMQGGVAALQERGGPRGDVVLRQRGVAEDGDEDDDEGRELHDGDRGSEEGDVDEGRAADGDGVDERPGDGAEALEDDGDGEAVHRVEYD